MLEKFKYINHLGETLEFGTQPLFVNENDLRDFAWSVKSANDKISGFKKGIVSKTIPIIIKCQNASESVEIKNRIFEVFEKDVLAEKYGKIVVGDYHLKCYVTDSKKKSYLVSKDFLQLDLKVQTDVPQWIKETTVNFNTKNGNNSDFLDFAYDFPFDFKNGLSVGEINNTGFVPCDFKMIIYGATKKPSVFIGGHEYYVDVEIGASEFLTIDSAKKTVVLTKYNGTEVNCFNNRSRDSYVFKKIPSGISSVSSGSDGICVDITLIEERSEPKWT